MFKKAFSFEGRIRRTEYGLSLLIYLVAILLINVLVESEDMAIIALFFIFPLCGFCLRKVQNVVTTEAEVAGGNSFLSTAFFCYFPMDIPAIMSMDLIQKAEVI